MKSSEAAAAIVARTGAPVTQLPLVSSGVVDYRATRILQTEGNAEAESRSYGRDALDRFDRRKNMHKILDRLCCDAAMTQEESSPLHAALDREMDEDPDDDEEEEPGEWTKDEPAGRNKWLHDALDQLLAKVGNRKNVVAKDRSVAMDAAPKRKICCVDCASLDGIKGFRQAQRAYEASRAHLI